MIEQVLQEEKSENLWVSFGDIDAQRARDNIIDTLMSIYPELTQQDVEQRVTVLHTTL